MLERAGVANTERLVEQKRINDILPLVAEAAYRAKYTSDKDSITRGTMAQGERLRA